MTLSRLFPRRYSPDVVDVLELRIHGVSNTSVAAMLDLPLDQVERVSGDDLGGFWAPTPAASDRGSRLPPEDRHHIAPGVQREAYTWGLLARTEPGAAGRALGVAGAVATRLGWALLIPFGLANAAYWSRAIPVPEENSKGWRDANGAAELRAFALALTLLITTSVSAVSLDLFAVQCYPGQLDGTGVVARCDQLPTVLDGLAAWTRGERLALASLAPVLVLLGLFWLARAGRVRYDEGMSQPASGRSVRAVLGAGAPRPVGPRVPVLATTGFWHKRLLSITTARLHLAAGLSLVAVCLAWDRVFAARSGCADPHTFLGATCRAGLDRGWTRGESVVAWLGVGAVVVLVLVVCRVCISSEAGADVSPHPAHAARAIWSGWLLLAASGLLAGIGLLLWAPWTQVSREPDPDGVRRTLAGLVDGAVAPSADASSMLGLLAVPTVIVAILIGLSIAGLGWRRGVGARWWLTLFVLGGGFLLVAALAPTTGPAGGWVLRDWARLGAGCTVVLQLVFIGRGGRRMPTTGEPRTRGANRAEAWRGTGPGIFMLLAAGAGMVLSALVVTGTAAWLNATSGAVSVAVPPASATALPCIQTCKLPMRPLVVPSAYREFGAATLGAVLLLLIACAGLVFLRGRLTFLPPAPQTSPPPTAGTGAEAATGDPAAAVDVLRLTERALRVLRGRRSAANAQLVEPVVGCLAGAMGLALIATVGMSGRVAVWEWLESTGSWALGVAALAIVSASVAGAAGAVKGSGRPLGLVWDVMCFLPRAAHPFGPPSYAERVVPELRGRVDHWLAGSPSRSVVLSAHSLGAVLAVACLLAVDEDPAHPRIGLLTYGTQLRPYFGRFFPELLGPMAVGTAPCSAPRPTRPDPWQDEVLRPPDPPLPDGRGGPDTVLRRLGGLGGDARPPAWINLWRRTDPLGLPAVSYGANPVDRGAEEIDRTAYLFTLATHGEYPQSLAYHDALNEVRRRLTGRS